MNTHGLEAQIRTTERKLADARRAHDCLAAEYLEEILDEMCQELDESDEGDGWDR